MTPQAAEFNPSLSLVRRAIWVTWEHQRRNQGMARGLGIPLFEFDFTGNSLVRYARALAATYRVFRRERPELIFVQNPSLVLTLSALAYGTLRRIPIVVDAHNAALDRLGPGLLGWPHRLATRHAHLTIVSNARLSTQVEAQNGRPFILPDPLPTLSQTTPPATQPGSRRVLFVCTYASDEPYLAVLEAARSLEPDIVVYFTGNPRRQADRLRRLAPPNVTFTGYLPDEDYLELLGSVDVVVDLTTRQDCLVCGAYEGVASEKPLILSDTAAIREYFSRGVRYTDNSPEDIANAIREALNSAETMRAALKELKPSLVADWNRRRQALIALLMTPIVAI
jgi:glycosyltransferase involved in cell wall biosynthesis